MRICQTLRVASREISKWTLLTTTDMSWTKKNSWAITSTCKKGSWIPELDSSSFSHCRCSHCAAVHTSTAHWTNLQKPHLKSHIRIGQRVLVGAGRLSGVVKYIGDLNSSHTNDPLYAGVKLDDPVGEHDGMFHGKRFFSCPENHGLIFPIDQVYQSPLNPSISPPSSSSSPSSGAARHKRSLGGTRCDSERCCGGLGSMLGKSWARDRIRSWSQSPEDMGDERGRRDRDMRLATTTTTTAAASVLAQTFCQESGGIGDGKTGVEEKKVVEGGYSNKGDMIIEDAEEEEVVSGKDYSSITVGQQGRPTPRPPTLTSSAVATVTASTPPKRAATCLVMTTTARGSGVEDKSTRFTSSQFSGLSGSLLSLKDTTDDSSDALLSSSLQSDSTAVAMREVRPVTRRPAADKDKSLFHKTCNRGTGGCPRMGVCCEEFDSSFSSDSGSFSSPLPPPPPPPSSEASTTFSSGNRDSVETIAGQESLTSCLISGLPPSPSPPSDDDGPAMLHEAEGAVGEMASFDRTMEAWGGNLRAWFMAGTYQKLKKAVQRGIREIHWQRKIHEIEKTGNHPTVTRNLRDLRTNIGENRHAAGKVRVEAKAINQRKRQKLVAVKRARANLEDNQEIARKYHFKIMEVRASDDRMQGLQRIAQEIIQQG